MAKKKMGKALAGLAALAALAMPAKVDMRKGRYAPNSVSDEELLEARKKALPGAVFTESGQPLETEGADGFGATYVKSGMKKGGMVKSPRRGDGIAVRGRTKGRLI
jgi:hypothetical protein